MRGGNRAQRPRWSQLTTPHRREGRASARVLGGPVLVLAVAYSTCQGSMVPGRAVADEAPAGASAPRGGGPVPLRPPARCLARPTSFRCRRRRRATPPRSPRRACASAAAPAASTTRTALASVCPRAPPAMMPALGLQRIRWYVAHRSLLAMRAHSASISSSEAWVTSTTSRASSGGSVLRRSTKPP